MGLDFIWVSPSDYPPTALNADREWVFEEGVWSDHCFNYFAAAYTEGPQFVDEPTTVGQGNLPPIGAFAYAVNNGEMAIVQSKNVPENIIASYGLQNVSQYYVWIAGPQFDSYEFIPFWSLIDVLAPWRKRVSYSLDGYSATDACIYRACTDPNANNQDPEAQFSCIEDDNVLTARLDDPTGGPSIDFDVVCNNIPFSLNICSTPGSPNVGETNLSPNVEPGKTIANPNLFGLYNNIEVYDSNNNGQDDSIRIISNYAVTAEAIINKINIIQLPCPSGSIGQTSYGFNLSVYDSCAEDSDPDNQGGDGGVVPDAAEAYVYFTGCCEYDCDGYYIKVDGAPTNLDEWTGDFATDGSGRSECVNFQFPKSEFGGGANPNLDYNPNVSGIQPEPD